MSELDDVRSPIESIPRGSTIQFEALATMARDANRPADRFDAVLLYSNEGSEPAHIHIEQAGALAKFWLDPVSLAGSVASNFGGSSGK